MVTFPPARWPNSAASMLGTMLNSRTASIPNNCPLTPPGVELMALLPPGYSTPFHKKMFSPGRRPATEK